MLAAQRQADLMEIVLASRPVAASRIFGRTGRSRAIKAPLMAMTTSNSMSVNPDRQEDCRKVES
jgi:hypothetical protein